MERERTVRLVPDGVHEIPRGFMHGLEVESRSGGGNGGAGGCWGRQGQAKDGGGCNLFGSFFMVGVPCVFLNGGLEPDGW